MKEKIDYDYWNGNKNKLVRYYFYIQKGLESLNFARYYVMSIFAIYFAMKINNIFILPLMFITVLPILAGLGWLNVHHMAKIMEFLNIKYSTHYSKRNYDLQEERNKILIDLLPEDLKQKYNEKEKN